MPIRAATEADIEAIRRIVRASWEADYPDILSRETAESGVDEWYSPDELTAELSHPRSVIAVFEESDAVMGFVHAITGETVGHVLRLYVAPAHRRQGIGRRLLDHAIDEMATLDHDRVAALVLAQNDLGVEFYRAAGFETVDDAETAIGGTAYRELRMERPITR